MEEHGHHEPPPFSGENGNGLPGAKLEQHSPAYAGEQIWASSTSLIRGNQADAKKKEVQNQHKCRDGSLTADRAPERLAHGNQRKTQARAALVAARRANAHQCSACRADFWTWLLLAAEKSAHRVLPFFHAPLPPVGKCQFSSLRPANGVPIIPK